MTKIFLFVPLFPHLRSASISCFFQKLINMSSVRKYFSMEEFSLKISILRSSFLIRAFFWKKYFLNFMHFASRWAFLIQWLFIRVDIEEFSAYLLVFIWLCLFEYSFIRLAAYLTICFVIYDLSSWYFFVIFSSPLGQLQSEL